MPTESPTYPDQYAVEPLSRPPSATVRVPGSKSLTNRALVLAALAKAPDGCLLRGVLHSEDTEVMVESLRRLGFAIDVDWTASTLTVSHREGPLIPVPTADLFVA